MTFATYTELQTAIADELNRTDLTSAIPTFIRLCEDQTERQLRVREMLVVNQAFTVDAEYVATPTDLLETRSFYLNTMPVQQLEFKSIDSLIVEKANNSGVGQPFAFTVLGDNFQFVKTPDSVYSATLIYYQRLPRLSDTNATNWLLDRYGDVYFYGALLNSAPYLKEDARVALWVQLYQGAIEALKVSDDRAQTASNGLRATARMF